MINLLSRLEPVAGSPREPARIEALEGLRGCAALAVLYGHMTSPKAVLDPGYVPSPAFWWFENSIQAVLLFFLLSGFVIGLTNTGAFSASAVLAYLRRRAVRLLPIYWFALIAGWLLSPSAGWGDLVGHALFWQNESPGLPHTVPLLSANANLWSLHYEMLYYLLFPALWYARPPLVPLFAGALFVAVLGVALPGFPLAIAWLASGFIFWAAGLAVAWWLPSASGPENAPWPSVLLLAFATWQLQIFDAVLNRLGFPAMWASGVLIDYLDSLPVLLWLFLLLSGRRLPAMRWLEAVCWLLPACYIAWRYARGTWTWSGEHNAVLSMLILAALVRHWRPGLGVFRRLAPLGAISYALYTMGAPVQHFVLHLFPEFSGTAFTFAVRALLVLLLLFPAAWLLEAKIQPAIRAWLSRGFGREPASNPRSA